MTPSQIKLAIAVAAVALIAVGLYVSQTDNTAPQTTGMTDENKASRLAANTKQIKISQAKDVTIESLDALIALFDSLNYNNESWREGNREVPRLTFKSVSEKWQQTSNEIPVQTKKWYFSG